MENRIIEVLLYNEPTHPYDSMPLPHPTVQRRRKAPTVSPSSEVCKSASSSILRSTVATMMTMMRRKEMKKQEIPSLRRQNQILNLTLLIVLNQILN